MIVALGSTDFTLFAQVMTGLRVPVDADSHAVTYEIFANNNPVPLLDGSFIASIVNGKTGWYMTAALAITTANGFAARGLYRVRIAFAHSGGTLGVIEQEFNVD